MIINAIWKDTGLKGDDNRLVYISWSMDHWSFFGPVAERLGNVVKWTGVDDELIHQALQVVIDDQPDWVLIETRYFGENVIFTPDELSTYVAMNNLDCFI